MLLNISSYASADLLDQTSQASLLKHMKKYSIAREWASNCSHYPVVHITPLFTLPRVTLHIIYTVLYSRECFCLMHMYCTLTEIDGEMVRLLAISDNDIMFF